MTAVIPSGSLAHKRRLAGALIARQQYTAPAPRRRDGKPAALNLLTWTSRYRRELKPGFFFSMPDHLYLRDIYLDTARDRVCMKAAQIGISELLVSDALYSCDQRGLDVLYLMPTIADISDFSQSRFGPALEASDYLNGIVVGSSKHQQRGADKVSLKRIRNNFLYMRPGSVSKDGRARQMKSIPVDKLFLDEVDEMDTRATVIARKRMGHSPIRESWAASTPTYHGVGIHAEWEGSDQREWFIPCPHCGERQQLLISNVVREWDELGRPLSWYGQEDGRAYVACVKCGREMDRLAVGEWVPAYPNRRVHGYHPTKLMAAHTPLIEVVQNLQAVDETARKEAFNQDLGLPYTPRGGRLTFDDLDKCKREYDHGALPRMGAVMGVDVGKVLHVVIRAQPDGEGKRRQLFAGIVPGFPDVAQLMYQYEVQCCVVDALPETRSARAFQADFKDGVVWLCYYAGEKGVEPAIFNAKDGLVNAARTWSLDITHSRFYSQENTLPATIRAVPDFYEQMTAMVRVVEEKKDGTAVAHYISKQIRSGTEASSTGKDPDHFAHAENYATIASLRRLTGAPTVPPVVTSYDDLFN